MNLYLVHAQNLQYTEWISREIGGPTYDDGAIWLYVYAETAGKAKSIVFEQEKRNYDDLEWTDLKVKLQLRNQDAEAGVTDCYNSGITLPKRTSEELLRQYLGDFSPTLDMTAPEQQIRPFIWDNALQTAVYTVGSEIEYDGGVKMVITDIADFGPDWLLEIEVSS